MAKWALTFTKTEDDCLCMCFYGKFPPKTVKAILKSIGIIGFFGLFVKMAAQYI